MDGLAAAGGMAVLLYWPYRGGEAPPRGKNGALLAAVCAGLVFSAAQGMGALERAVYSALLAALALVDARHGILPHRLTWPGIAAGIGFAAGSGALAMHAVAALAAGSAFLVLALLRPDAIGGGDMWMAAMLGAFLGPGVLFALAVGALSASVIGIGWALVRRRPWRGAVVRFGPFLALGGAAAAWFGF